MPPRRVLWVDDDAGVRRFATLLLGKHYDLTTAVTAEEALTLLDGTRFDVLVTDYLMPGMNGLQLLEHLARKDAAIPSLLVTGALHPEGLRRAEQLGVPVLPKPVQATVLMQAVQEAIDGILEA